MATAIASKPRGKYVPRKQFLKQIHEEQPSGNVRYLDYEPRGALKDIFACHKPEFITSGPAGTGKTRGSLEKAHFMLEKYPNIRGLMVRKTRRSMTQSCMVTFETKVLPYKNYVPFHGGDQEYRYPNGSILAIAGVDDPLKIYSSEWDFVYVNQAEELELGHWETIISRNRNWKMPYQQVFGDANPGAPGHWIKTRSAAGALKLFESRHEDNPELYNGYCPTHECIEPEWTCRGKEYISKLDALTGVRWKRLRKGLWAAAEGMVYEESWDRALHVIPRFLNAPLDKDQVPKEWPRYWAVDFGYTNPFVWSAWAMDPDGRLFRYKEIYKTKTIVEDHAKRILEVTKDEPKPRAIICDHDAEDRATLERHLGMKTQGAWKAVGPGIQAVEARLRVAGDGKPRIFYLEDSVVDIDPALLEAHKPTCTEDEYEVYIWDTSNNRKRGEEPVKEYDHGQDETRYLVTHVDDTASKRPQFFTVGGVSKSGGSTSGQEAGGLVRMSPWRMS